MKKLHLIVLFFIVLVYLFSGYLINSKRVLPLENDEAAHLTHSFYYYDIFKNPFPHTFDRLLNVDDQWPPFFHFICGLFCFVFGKSFNTFTLVHAFYLILMLFSIYFIARKAHSIESGLISMVIFSAFPMTFMLYNWFILEFSLASLVILGIVCLVYSDEFKNTKYSLLFGLLLGIGMLTKWTFAFFIIGPFVYFVIRCVCKKSKIGYVNILLSLIVFIIIGGPWLTRHFVSLISKIPIGMVRTSEVIPLISFKSGLFYLKSIFHGISWLLFLLVSVSVIFIRKINLVLRNVLLLLVLPAYLIFTFISNKWAHYIFPVLPVLAILSGICAAHLIKNTSRIVKVAFYLFLFFLLLANTVVMPAFYPVENGIKPYLLNNVSKEPCNVNSGNSNFIEADTTPVRSLLGDVFRDYLRVTSYGRFEYINKHNRNVMEDVLFSIDKINKNKSSVVGFIDLTQPPVFFNLRYLVELDERRIDLISFPYSKGRFFNKLSEFDFLLINFSGPIGKPSSVKEMLQAEKMYEAYNLKDFDVWKFESAFGALLDDFEVVNIHRMINYNSMCDSFLCLLRRNSSGLVVSQDAVSDEMINFHGHFYDYLKSFRSLIKNEGNIELKNKNLKVVFDNGKFDIYWKNIKVTNSPGLYTSFYIEGMRFDSVDFIWDAGRVINNEIILKCYSRFWPLSQVWSIKIEEDKIYFKIYLVVDSFIFRLESYQASLVFLGEKDKPGKYFNTKFLPAEPYKNFKVSVEGCKMPNAYIVSYSSPKNIINFKASGMSDLFEGYVVFE